MKSPLTTSAITNEPKSKLNVKTIVSKDIFLNIFSPLSDYIISSIYLRFNPPIHLFYPSTLLLCHTNP